MYWDELAAVVKQHNGQFNTLRDDFFQPDNFWYIWLEFEREKGETCVDMIDIRFVDNSEAQNFVNEIEPKVITIRGPHQLMIDAVHPEWSIEDE